jgi:hypothetical protein
MKSIHEELANDISFQKLQKSLNHSTITKCFCSKVHTNSLLSKTLFCKDFSYSGQESDTQMQVKCHSGYWKHKSSNALSTATSNQSDGDPFYPLRENS